MRFLVLLAIAAFAAPGAAADFTDPKADQEALPKVPGGFEVTLFAKEPLVRQPCSMAFDARHRLVEITSPTTASGAATTSWTHDPDGNVLSQATPNGELVTSAFDALNRRITEEVASPLPEEIAATARHYDGNGNVRMIRESLGVGTVRQATRSYDAFDRLDRDQDVYGRELAYQYDSVGNRTHLTDADGQTTIWAYDPLNRVSAMTVPGQGTTVFESFLSGKPHILIRPDGSTSTTGYDLAGRTASVVHAKAGVPIAEVAYAYDANGNRTEQREQNGPVTGDVEQVTTYTYDRADRLTGIHAPDRRVTYTLDPVGNRTNEQMRTGADVLVGDSTLSYNARDQLTERDDPVAGLHVELSWDANGNVLTQVDPSGERSFSYDARDRLLTLAQPNAPPLAFDYQSDGLRLAKRHGTAETRYQYDQQSLIAETNAIGNTLTRYHYGATHWSAAPKPAAPRATATTCSTRSTPRSRC